MRARSIVLGIAVAINALFLFTYFSTLVTSGNRSANGFGAVFLIIFLGLLDMSLFIIFYVKRFSLVRAGLLIAVLPIICAFLYSLFHGVSIFDEGSGGGGYLWLLIITVPIGLLLIAIGLIVKLLRGR